MDTKNDCKIPECGSLPDLSRNKVLVGAKQLKKALKKGIARYVYLAENADPSVTEPIEAMCRSYSIQYAWVSNMRDLGSACGIEVGAAAAAVVEEA